MGNTKLRAKYPQALSKCLPEAMAYGQCVVSSIELKFKECEKEFQAFTKCFERSIKQQAK